jgi:hypothetical protein
MKLRQSCQRLSAEDWMDIHTSEFRRHRRFRSFANLRAHPRPFAHTGYDLDLDALLELGLGALLGGFAVRLERRRRNGH